MDDKTTPIYHIMRYTACRPDNHVWHWASAGTSTEPLNDDTCDCGMVRWSERADPRYYYQPPAGDGDDKEMR